jgi:hypothetical protein
MPMAPELKLLADDISPMFVGVRGHEGKKEEAHMN